MISTSKAVYSCKSAANRVSSPPGATGMTTMVASNRENCDVAGGGPSCRLVLHCRDLPRADRDQTGTAAATPSRPIQGNQVARRYNVYGAEQPFSRCPETPREGAHSGQHLGARSIFESESVQTPPHVESLSQKLCITELITVNSLLKTHVRLDTETRTHK